MSTATNKVGAQLNPLWGVIGCIGWGLVGLERKLIVAGLEKPEKCEENDTLNQRGRNTITSAFHLRYVKNRGLFLA